MVFKRFINNNSGFSSKDIYLGAPEAEAEATFNSRLSLFDVYEDYNGLFHELSHEKFIILGRKGTGKTAFGEYIQHLAGKDPNLFCTFVKKNDTNLEHIVQIGQDCGHPVQIEALFKWVILTRILRMFTENQAIQDNKSYNLLREFLKKNSGYVDVRNTELKELVTKQGFDINIEYLRRFFTSKYNKSVDIKSEKAAFYKILPHLEEIITKVLTSDEERKNGNSYIIFFDDLDIGLSHKNQTNIDSLISLLRVSKYINNDIFGKHNVASKVIILLRDDIATSVSGHNADTAKIFTSYSTRIDWYQYELLKPGAIDTPNILKFINKRIANCFSKLSMDFNADNPWFSLVEDQPNRAQFKYIIDHTLFRPRDLLLFFKALSETPYELPLNRYDVNNLLNKYSREFLQELKNELTFYYDSNQIIMIINALREIQKSSPCSFTTACKLINEHCSNIEPEELLEKLYGYSIIGNITTSGYVSFKFREHEKGSESGSIDKSKSIILQKAMKNYLSN